MIDTGSARVKLTRGNEVGLNCIAISRPPAPGESAPSPAAGSTLEVFRRGAILAEARELLEGDSVELALSSPGYVSSGDIVSLPEHIGNPDEGLYVVSVAPGGAKITLQYAGARLQLSVGDSLIPVGTRPTMRAGSLSGPVVTSVTCGPAGLAEFFCSNREFELVIRHPAGSGLGVSSVAVPTELRPTPGETDDHLSVADFDSVQSAIDATPPGGRLFFPAGEYFAESSSGWAIWKPIELFGASAGTTDGRRGTVLRPFGNQGGTRESTVLTVRPLGLPSQWVEVLSGVHLHDFTIAPLATPTVAATPGSEFEPHGDGIFVGLDNHTAGLPPVIDVRIERVSVWGMGRDGIHVSGLPSVDLVRVVDSQCNDNWRHGVYANNAAALTMRDALCQSNGRCGLYAYIAQAIRVHSCYFQMNARLGGDPLLGQAYLSVCHAFSMVGTGFEAFHGDARGNQRALVVQNCFGGVVLGCQFVNAVQSPPLPALDPRTVGVYLNEWNQGIVVGGNHLANVAYAVYENKVESNRNNIYLPNAADEGPGVSNSGVNVLGGLGFGFLPTSNPAKVNQAAGVVLARLASSGLPFPSEEPGMLIFNDTTKRLMYYDGAGWNEVAINK